MLEINDVDGICVVSFGEINKFNAMIAESVKEDIISYLDKYKKLILNMGGVRYLDSTALAILISAHRKAEEKGVYFSICNLSSEAISIIHLMKLQNILNISSSLDECLMKAKEN